MIQKTNSAESQFAALRATLETLYGGEWVRALIELAGFKPDSPLLTPPDRSVSADLTPGDPRRSGHEEASEEAGWDAVEPYLMTLGIAATVRAQKAIETDTPSDQVGHWDAVAAVATIKRYVQQLNRASPASDGAPESGAAVTDEGGSQRSGGRNA